MNRNAVVLAVPSRDGVEAARSAARSLLGWEEVQSQLSEVESVDLARQARLAANLKEARRRLPEVVQQAYGVVVATDPEGAARAFRLPAGEEPLFTRIKAAAKARIQETALEPAALLPGGPYDLWREDEPSRRVAELAVAFARYSRLPKLLRPGVVLDTVFVGVREGILVARQPRPDRTARTFWREEVDADAVRDPELEVVLPGRAELTRLDPALLLPGALPELWDGDSIRLGELLRYFAGGQTVTVKREGFDEVLPVPRCAPEVVRAAAAASVESGGLWLVSGPTSLWKEPAPTAVLGAEATLRGAPELVALQDLAADSLPAAWEGGATNGNRLTTALSQERGEALPWGLVRESVRAAVNTRWLEVVEGSADCRWDQAGALKLKRPERVPPEDPTPRSQEVLLEPREFDDFADRWADLMDVTAGHGLRPRVALEVAPSLPADARDAANRILAKVHPDLKLK